ncbi:hypothetical protein Tco_0078177 [Tanacetum coccineum]
MLTPKGLTFNGRPTFANPMYLKKAQSEKPCLYEIPYDQSDPTNRLVPDREETLTLEKESQSKLNKDLVRPYDYTKINTLYEIFKPATQEYHEQLAHANEVRKKIWRKYFVISKPKIFKNIDFLPVSKSIKIDELESDKAEFSNMYDILLQECVSNDVMCSYLHSLSDLDLTTGITMLLGKPPLQPIRNQLVVRQPTAYKSKRSQLPRHWFASQVGVSHDLTKPVTLYSWPQVRKLSFAKPYDVNVPGPSRNSPKHVSFQSPRESVGSNDMVHNYYLEEAKKKAQL